MLGCCFLCVPQSLICVPTLNISTYIYIFIHGCIPLANVSGYVIYNDDKLDDDDEMICNKNAQNRLSSSSSKLVTIWDQSNKIQVDLSAFNSLSLSHSR